MNEIYSKRGEKYREYTILKSKVFSKYSLEINISVKKILKNKVLMDKKLKKFKKIDF